MLLVLGSGIAHSQSVVNFEIIGKAPSLIGTAFGGALTPQSMVVRDWDNYYIYSFAAQEWNKLKFKESSVRSLDGMTWISTVYLPTFGKVITMSDELEILDLQTLELGHIKIEGGAPVLFGAVEWKEKIYLFGGYIMINIDKGNERQYSSGIGRPKPGQRVLVPSNKLIAFDPATLAYEELGMMPGYHYRLGAFVNEQLYAVGPTPGRVPATDIIRYDLIQKRWEHLVQLPVDVGAMAQDGDVLYFLGLDDHEGFLITLDTKTGKQTRYATNVPWTQGLVFVRDHQLYYFAGMKENPKVRDVFFRDPRWLMRNMYKLELTTLAK